MSQGLILGPLLLFLVYVNDLNKPPDALDSIIFTDHTNLFYSHQNMKTLFGTVNRELRKICEWFKVNLLFLHVTKTNHMLSHKSSSKDSYT